MKKFTTNYNNNLRVEFNTKINEAVATMYPDLSMIDTYIHDAHKASRMLMLKTGANIAQVHKANIEQTPTAFAAYAKSLPQEEKGSLYTYYHQNIRVMFLNSLIQAKVKLRPVVTDALTNILRDILNNGKESITLGQALNAIKLKTNLVNRFNQVESTTEGVNEEIKLQLLSELCSLNILDMRVSQHTHLISIPEKLTDKLAKQEWKELADMADYLSKKTILLEPAPVEKQMITRSSWFYQTPTLSDAQIKFINTMHSTKYEFIDNAENLIAEAYKAHLKLSVLPDWALTRIEFFKEQIRASKANGGHYIAGKFDSALRWYFMAEIGHLQSSVALRSLVKVSDLTNKVKYDMSNNVVQMYALALGTKSLGKYVKLLPKEQLEEDMRLQIADQLNTKLNINKFNKDNIKPLFMVWAYNAGKRRLLDGCVIEEKGFFGEGKQVIKVEGLMSITGIKDEDKLWSTWSDTVNTIAPAIVALKAMFNKLTKGNPFTIANWELPDNSIAQYASAETLAETLYWVDATGYRRQHTHHRKVLVENAKAAGLLPRAIHSLDAYVARTLVNQAKDLGITVVPNHDSFTFDEQYTDVMFELVREIFATILEGGCFGHIVTKLNTAKVSLAIKDANDKYITEDSFGDRLTRADLMESTPMVWED